VVPLTDISVSCPEARRTTTRRHQHQKWWQTKEWKALVKKETAGKVCSECGVKEGEQKLDKEGNPRFNKKGIPIVAHLTLDHPDRWAYKSFEIYIASDTPRRVVCTDCNYLYEKGLRICPVCHKNRCSWRSEMCKECRLKENPDLVEMYKRADERIKELQKQYRKDQYQKAKQYKKDHPLKKSNANIKKKNGVS
jgi:hypothetical protein